MTQSPVSLQFMRLEPSTGEPAAAGDKISLFFQTTEQKMYISYCNSTESETEKITLGYDTPISVIKNLLMSMLLYHKMHHISVSAVPEYIDYFNYRFPCSKRKMYLYDEVCRAGTTILDGYIEHLKYIIGYSSPHSDTPAAPATQSRFQLITDAAANDANL